MFLCKLSLHYVRLPDCKSGLVLILLWLYIGLLLEAWVAYIIFSELKFFLVDPVRQISTHLFRFDLFKLHTYLVLFYISLENKTIKHFMCVTLASSCPYSFVWGLRPPSKILGTLPSLVTIFQVPKCRVIIPQIHQKLP